MPLLEEVPSAVAELPAADDGVGRLLGVRRSTGPEPSQCNAATASSATGSTDGVALREAVALVDGTIVADAVVDDDSEGDRVALGVAPMERDAVGDTMVPVDVSVLVAEPLLDGVAGGVALGVTVADPDVVGVRVGLRDDVSDREMLREGDVVGVAPLAVGLRVPVALAVLPALLVLVLVGEGVAVDEPLLVRDCVPVAVAVAAGDGVAVVESVDVLENVGAPVGVVEMVIDAVTVPVGEAGAVTELEELAVLLVVMVDDGVSVLGAVTVPLPLLVAETVEEMVLEPVGEAPTVAELDALPVLLVVMVASDVAEAEKTAVSLTLRMR